LLPFNLIHAPVVKGAVTVFAQLLSVHEVRLAEADIFDIVWVALRHHGLRFGHRSVDAPDFCEELFWNFDYVDVRIPALLGASRNDVVCNVVNVVGTNANPPIARPKPDEIQVDALQIGKPVALGPRWRLPAGSLAGSLRGETKTWWVPAGAELAAT